MSSPMILQPGAAPILYSTLYSAIWQTGVWLPEQDWALWKDPDVWAKVRRDPVVEHAISMRLHSIASRFPRVLPGGEDDDSRRLAELTERALDEIEDFTAAQYQLTQAVLLGRAYGYIEGRREKREVDLDGTSSEMVDLWMPTRIVPVDRNRIRFKPQREQCPDGRTRPGKVDIEFATFSPGVFKVLSDKQWLNFIKVTFDNDESRLGYGRGLLGAIYFYHYAKGVTLREGLRGVERWAQGLKVIKLNPDRAASAGKTNEALKQQYLDTIEKNMARNTLVMDQGDEFQAMWPSGEGSRLVLDMCNYLDQGVTQLILGAVLPTGGGQGGGSFARASVEEDSSARLVDYDRQLLDGALTRDLVGQFLRLNRTQLQRLGLARAKKPRIASVSDRKPDPQVAAGVVETMLRAGVPLRRDEVYEKTGWTPPKPGEEVIEAVQAPQPGMGGFGGGMDDPFPDEPGTEPDTGADSGHGIPEDHRPGGDEVPDVAATGPRTARLRRKKLVTRGAKFNKAKRYKVRS